MVSKNKKDKAETPPESFKNRAQAARWLKDAGYKITAKTFYNHVDAGRIKPDVGEKGFSLKNVKVYALGLDKVDTLKSQKEEERYNKKSSAQTQKLEAETKLIKLKYMKEEGKVVEKALVYQQFAALVVGLDNSIEGQAQIEAEESAQMIIDAENPAAMFFEVVKGIKDRALNEMAKIGNLEVVFGDAE